MTWSWGACGLRTWLKIPSSSKSVPSSSPNAWFPLPFPSKVGETELELSCEIGQPWYGAQLHILLPFCPLCTLCECFVVQFSGAIFEWRFGERCKWWKSANGRNDWCFPVASAFKSMNNIWCEIPSSTYWRLLWMSSFDINTYWILDFNNYLLPKCFFPDGGAAG